MSRLSETTSSESAAEPLSPSVFEKSFIIYLMRRKGLLGLLGSLVVGAAGWGLHQYVEMEARKAVQAQSEQIQAEMKSWRENEIKALVEISKRGDKIQELIAEVAEEREEAAKVLKEMVGLQTKLTTLVVAAEKIPEALDEVKKMRGELGTIKDIAGLRGDVNKIIESLLKNRDFQQTLTGSVSAEIAEVRARAVKLEEEAKGLVERMNAHDQQVNRLAGHPLIGGVPYRVLHVEENAAKDFVTVHQASSLKRPVGKVFYDVASERAQFYRLSTSTSHEVDADGRSEVPRCNVLFKGWLPEKALKLDEADFRDGEPTMIELRAKLGEEDQVMREGPGYDQRSLATFDGYNMPFFTTGNRKTEWVEVTFEGWMAVTNGKSSGEPGYKSYMAATVP